MKQNLLSIAGLDPSAGAGMTADLKVFEHFGFNGFAMATALTVQNSLGVQSVNEVEATLIEEQARALFEDFNIAGLKLGMLANEKTILAIVALIQTFDLKNIILDPILVSSSGKRLLSESGQETMIKELLPHCSLITPNIPEATSLTGVEIIDHKSLEDAGQKLLKLGAKAVLIKGGHSSGPPTDWFFEPDQSLSFTSKKHEGPSPHGTGCHLSSAILCLLADGNSLPTAIEKAKAWLLLQIQNSKNLGQGSPYLQITSH